MELHLLDNDWDEIVTPTWHSIATRRRFAWLLIVPGREVRGFHRRARALRHALLYHIDAPAWRIVRGEH